MTYGNLHLKQLQFTSEKKPKTVVVTSMGATLRNTYSLNKNQVVINFDETELLQGNEISVVMNF